MPCFRSALTLLALLPTLALPLLAQQRTRADSARRDSVQTLEELTVTRTPESRRTAPVAVDVVDKAAIQRGQLTIGLDESLQNLPGTFVANRFNFAQDQRLSIRGAGSRANFGTRGVRILLDGIPQTLPDGQSQFTNIDFGAVGRIEVLRGASSALYGNASGGVIQLETEAPDQAESASRLRVLYGSFETSKVQSTTSFRRENLSGVINLSRLRTDNFRQWSEAETRLANVKFTWAANERNVLTFVGAYANWPISQNAGALTLAEIRRNPDTAAANNILRRANEITSQGQLGVTWKHFGAGGDETNVTVFGLWRDFDAPMAAPQVAPVGPTVGTYNNIDRQVYGARLTHTRPFGDGPRAPRVTVGADFQLQHDRRNNQRAVAGTPTGQFTLRQRERVTEIGPFAQLVWSPAARVVVNGGVRYDRLGFNVQDRFLADGDNSGERIYTALNWSGGVSYDLGQAFVPYVNVSSSFETPTTTELIGTPQNVGQFVTTINPARSVNVEVGGRGRWRWAEYNVAVYRNDVRDAILPFFQDGARSFFQNVGRVRNQGIELGASITPIRQLRLFGAYTYSDYRFTDYVRTSGTTTTTFTGNRLPGVPQHFTRVGLRATPVRNVFLDVDHSWSTSVFANDENTVAADGWGPGLTNIRVSAATTLGAFSFAPFVGIYNLSNRRFVAAVTVNAQPAPGIWRVFEMGPPRNFYIGAEIGWRKP